MPRKGSESADDTTEDNVDDILMSYRWPGSRLTYGDFKRLCRVSNRVKRPVNQIIREAVFQYTTTLIAEFEEADRQYEQE